MYDFRPVAWLVSNAICALRPGSCSIRSTRCGPGAHRSKSTIRIRRFAPPPLCRTVILPLLLRPPFPWPLLGNVRGRNGRPFHRWSLMGRFRWRTPGVRGLYVRRIADDPSRPCTVDDDEELAAGNCWDMSEALGVVAAAKVLLDSPLGSPPGSAPAWRTRPARNPSRALSMVAWPGLVWREGCREALSRDLSWCGLRRPCEAEKS